MKDRSHSIHRFHPLVFKVRPRFRLRVGYFDEVLQGTASAPWLWWVAALVVIVLVILLGMKLLGLLPD